MGERWRANAVEPGSRGRAGCGRRWRCRAELVAVGRRPCELLDEAAEVALVDVVDRRLRRRSSAASCKRRLLLPNQAKVGVFGKGFGYLIRSFV